MADQLTIFDRIVLPPATSQLAAVLKMLIERDGVDERETPFNGFRSRISDLILKHGLNIRFIMRPFINQFGRKSEYRRHFLLSSDKAEAVELYNKING